jgi:hypothetical protein
MVSADERRTNASGVDKIADSEASEEASLLAQRVYGACEVVNW